MRVEGGTATAYVSLECVPGGDNVVVTVTAPGTPGEENPQHTSAIIDREEFWLWLMQADTLMRQMRDRRLRDGRRCDASERER